MEIKNNLQKLVDPYAQAQNAKQLQSRSQQGAAPAPQATGDRVSFSPAARLMQEAHAAATNAPEIRQDKVDSLKAQVESGTYTVDSKKVAAKMVQAESELFSTLQR